MQTALTGYTLARSALGLVDRPRVVPQLSLTDFKRAFYPDYEHPPHLALFDEALMDVARFTETGGQEGTEMLLVEMPPRHGKSLTLARFFVAWYLGRNPNKRVILVSNTQSNATENSTFVRNLLAREEWQDMYGLALADDSSAKSDWKLQGHEGGMFAIGMGGTVTSRGANLLICDDMLKGYDQAESFAQREKIMHSFLADFYTRRQPKCGIIVNATRWHEDDPTGRILQNFRPEQYRRIRFPALAEAEGDPLGREPGEALWPGWFPVEDLQRTREYIGAYTFSALYQQNPVPAEGGAWKRDWIYQQAMPLMDQFKRIVVGVDPAGTANRPESETGIVVCGLHKNGHAYVLDDASLNGSPDEWARAAVAAVERWSANYIVAEVNFGGDMVAHTIRTVNPNLMVKQVRASRGKLLRAEPIMARYEQGHVAHVRVFAELERQMISWIPGSESPDRMDALVWALTDVLGVMDISGRMAIGRHNLWGRSTGGKVGPS